MAQVTVTIDGKAYRMACEEGQEDHLSDLADQFDRYVSHLKGQFGEIGDLRITVMAGIMIMDELAEARRRMATIEADFENLKAESHGSRQDIEQQEAVVSAAIGDLAERLNAMAQKLNGRSIPVPAEN